LTLNAHAEVPDGYDVDVIIDEEAVLLAKEGDAEALEYLINKYKNFVRAKARSYFLIGADREDIIQEGMIGLYKAIRDFRGDKLSSFRAFAELCITRQIITAIKTATRQKHIPLNPLQSIINRFDMAMQINSNFLIRLAFQICHQYFPLQ